MTDPAHKPGSNAPQGSSQKPGQRPANQPGRNEPKGTAPNAKGGKPLDDEDELKDEDSEGDVERPMGERRQGSSGNAGNSPKGSSGDKSGKGGNTGNPGNSGSSGSSRSGR